ncbi:MAG: adenosylcobinamide-GDP ribazoletransferase [Gemmatimonadota bacterium]|nr:adenosylcobinamide-GDP ribazoletransferase [Gemmatimonadota bacterium]
MGGLTAALRLLTVVPVPGFFPEARGAAGRSTPWFPVVGALLGASAYLVFHLPVPRLVVAAFALGALVLFTGAMHEDGVMDVADALFVHGSRDRRIEVLADPRVGAYGATAGALSLLTRFALLGAIAPLGLLIAPVVGRWAMAVSLSQAAPLREEGLGASFAQGAQPVAATLSAFLMLGLVSVAGGGTAQMEAVARTGAAWALGAAAGAGVAALLIRRLGGLNGDGHGAVGHLAETAAFVAFVPLG